MMAAAIVSHLRGETVDQPSPARARYVLGVFVVVYAVNFIDRNILAVLLQPIKEELGVSDTAIPHSRRIFFFASAVSSSPPTMAPA